MLLANFVVLFAGLVSVLPVNAASSTLKSAAGARYFGAALAQGHLQNRSDTMFAALAAQQFSGATPENEMKWDTIEPNRNQFNFAPGDSIRDFALAHNFKLRGHTLVWHKYVQLYVLT